MFQRQMGSEVRAQRSEWKSTQLNSSRTNQWRGIYRSGLAALVLASATVSFAQNVENKKDDSQAASPTTPAQDATKSAAPVDAAHYIIGSEDTLQVTIWKEPTLSGTIPVRPDGRISLVLVGDLQAAGRTPMQLGDDITAKLKKYIQDPNVSVVVMSVNSQKIFLVGEVGHAGPLMMSAGMTPLQAIAASGGLSPYAKSKKIYILRGEAGKQVKIPFNYKQALKGDNSQVVELKPGDTIVVP